MMFVEIYWRFKLLLQPYIIFHSECVQLLILSRLSRLVQRTFFNINRRYTCFQWAAKYQRFSHALMTSDKYGNLEQNIAYIEKISSWLQSQQNSESNGVSFAMLGTRVTEPQGFEYPMLAAWSRQLPHASRLAARGIAPRYRRGASQLRVSLIIVSALAQPEKPQLVPHHTN